MTKFQRNIFTSWDLTEEQNLAKYLKQEHISGFRGSSSAASREYNHLPISGCMEFWSCKYLTRYSINCSIVGWLKERIIVKVGSSFALKNVLIQPSWSVILGWN